MSVRLLDVNDNVPKLTETQAFVCMAKPEPIIIKAEDADSAPFSQPFTFSFGNAKKSPNWQMDIIDGNTYNILKIFEVERCIIVLSDVIMVLFVCVCHAGTSARLTLKKKPTEDKTFNIPINIKDNAGLGITQSLQGELIL